MDRYQKLAQQSIEYYFRNKKALPLPDDLSLEMLKNKAGVFVSLHKSDHSLRGCIGTLLPTKNNMAEEIIHNALSAAFHDNRFYPLEEDELKDLVISVDVLSEPEPINSPEKLDTKKYGVIVQTKDGRSGVLLPNLDGIDTVEKQISIACQKGRIDPGHDKILLFRFTVERHE